MLPGDRPGRTPPTAPLPVVPGQPPGPTPGRVLPPPAPALDPTVPVPTVGAPPPPAQPSAPGRWQPQGRLPVAQRPDPAAAAGDQRRPPPWIFIGTAIGVAILVVGAILLTRGDGDGDDSPGDDARQRAGDVRRTEHERADVGGTGGDEATDHDRGGDDHRRADDRAADAAADARPDPRTDAGADTRTDAAAPATAARPRRPDRERARPCTLASTTTTRRPTENATVLRELTATLAAYPLGVVDWGAATSPGMRRRVNEDAWGRRDDLFVIADGMGGRGGGALAARTAIDRLARAGRAPAARDPTGGRSSRPSTPTCSPSRRAQGIDRVGTTLLAAVVGGPLVTLVHLGDSRAYRLTHVGESGPTGPRADAGRADRLDLLTHDHNVRAELLAAGLDVRDYRDRGVALHGLTSFVGLEHEVLRVDVLAVPVRSGDRVLLCTDGVYRQLDDDQLRLALGSRHGAAGRRGARRAGRSGRRQGQRDGSRRRGWGDERWERWMT